MSPHDQPLSRWNAQSLRSQIALVAQDDSLLQGTIAENISGFDEQTDMQLVRVCAELAQIRTEFVRHQDISPCGCRSSGP